MKLEGVGFKAGSFFYWAAEGDKGVGCFVAQYKSATLSIT